MNSESLFKYIHQLWDSLISDTLLLLPKFILAGLILLIGWLVARICQRISAQLILFLDKKLNAKLRISFLSVNLQQASQFVAKTIFWIIILFSIAMATQTLGIPVLTSWDDQLVKFMPNILAAVVIMLAGVIASRLVGYSYRCGRVS